MSDISQNVKSEKQWLRGLFMLLFFVVYEVTEMLVIFVAIIQFLFSIFTGKSNTNLRSFGDSLSQYAQQMVTYLSYNSEEKPFPFADWPKAHVTQDTAAVPTEEDETPPTTGS